MNLSMYDAKACAWGEESYPYPRTVAALLFPEVEFAIVHAVPGKDGVSAARLASSIPEGFRLDFATGSRKSGDYIMTKGHDVGGTFWDSPEERLAYGANLLTPCWAGAPRMVTLNVLVVEDGEWGTGDCHGKASAGVWGMFNGDDRRAAQFRAASREERFLAKGTLSLGDDGGFSLAREGIDMVLPLSAFKSSRKPETGMHTAEYAVGIISWSQMRPTKSSWQVTQWFSWPAVKQDLLPGVKEAAAKLLEAMVDTRALVELLSLDAKDIDTEFINILKADRSGALNQHPNVTRRLMEMLRLRWVDLALGGGMRFYGLMGLPDDSLALGEVRSDELRTGGSYISMRYPLRSWEDVRVWKCVGGSHERGVVYMSHETAELLGGDFDGDYFNFVEAERYPNMAAEIAAWKGTREAVEIIKTKDRKCSPDTQLHIAQEMLSNAENRVGIIALLIARAMATSAESLVPRLAQELQVAVDKFKYDLFHDEDFLDACGETMPKVWWVDDRRSLEAYASRTMERRGSEGTVGNLVRAVNGMWRPSSSASMSLDSFLNLFSDENLPEDVKQILPQARALNAHYGRLVSAALAVEDDDKRADSFSRIYVWLDDFAKKVQEQADAWFRAVWHVTHSSKSEASTASLAFHMFPQQIADGLRAIEVRPVTVVGLKYNEFNGDLQQFDGRTFAVEFVLDELSGKLRVAAHVDGKRLGFVSKETPVRVGKGPWVLARKGAVIHAAPVLS